jgi:hypothetical protein
MTSLNIPCDKESEDLPYLYWIPKLHKTPYKERYIAGSSTCVSFKRVFNLSCGRVVYRVEKSKVLMEDTSEKDLDLRLSKRSLEYGYELCPSLADLFLYLYESKFLQKLVKDKKIHEVRAFNFTSSMSYLLNIV